MIIERVFLASTLIILFSELSYSTVLVAEGQTVVGTGAIYCDDRPCNSGDHYYAKEKAASDARSKCDGHRVISVSPFSEKEGFYKPENSPVALYRLVASTTFQCLNTFEITGMGTSRFSTNAICDETQYVEARENAEKDAVEHCVDPVVKVSGYRET